jgi:hypothetical protein
VRTFRANEHDAIFIGELRFAFRAVGQSIHTYFLSMRSL